MGSQVAEHNSVVLSLDSNALNLFMVSCFRPWFLNKDGKHLMALDVTNKICPHFFVIGNCSSHHETLTCGVPLGSIFGPSILLLFQDNSQQIDIF